MIKLYLIIFLSWSNQPSSVLQVFYWYLYASWYCISQCLSGCKWQKSSSEEFKQEILLNKGDYWGVQGLVIILDSVGSKASNYAVKVLLFIFDLVFALFEWAWFNHSIANEMALISTSLSKLKFFNASKVHIIIIIITTYYISFKYIT